MSERRNGPLPPPVVEPFPEEILFAAEALRRGEVVAYPTETFYGLGVAALDELALARLRQLKGRAAEKTVSVLVAGDEMIDRLCRTVPPLGRRLMREHWPGPLTLALPARRGIPQALVKDGFVALRDSSHPTARALVLALGAPVTATSANLAGARPATTSEEVEDAFDGRCRVLAGGITPGGEPTTIARVRGESLEILRQGAIKLGPC